MDFDTAEVKKRVEKLKKIRKLMGSMSDFDLAVLCANGECEQSIEALYSTLEEARKEGKEEKKKTKKPIKSENDPYRNFHVFFLETLPASCVPVFHLTNLQTRKVYETRWTGHRGEN